MSNKYGARRTWNPHCQREFASKAESKRATTLYLLEKAGAISELEFQVRFPLKVNGLKVATYVCDFQYREEGNLIVEDCKGVRTALYRLKKKLVKALYGIEIRESTA